MMHAVSVIGGLFVLSRQHSGVLVKLSLLTDGSLYLTP